MSLFYLGASARRRSQPDAQPAEAAAQAPADAAAWAPADADAVPDSAPREITSYVGRYLTFIPGEVLAVYMMATSFVGDVGNDPVIRWVLSCVALILAPVVVWLGATRAGRGGATAPAFPAGRMVLAAIAFAAWAAAMPFGPLVPDLSPEHGRLVVAVVAMVSVVLPYIDARLKLGDADNAR
jgi:uncharacterized membrane protein YqaE (UPF0057 family)